MLQEYESKLDQHFESGPKRRRPTPNGTCSVRHALAASNGAQLTVLDDRSIRAEGKAEKGVYNVTFRTRLTGITAIRLEALPVEGLPGVDPGCRRTGISWSRNSRCRPHRADAPQSTGNRSR